MDQARGQLKKTIFIMFGVMLLMDFYPRFTGQDSYTAEPARNTTPPPQTNDDGTPLQPEEPSFYERKPRGDDTMIHVLNVQYCVSCSYKSNYQKLSEQLNQRYPTLIVEGSEYPTSPEKQLLSKAFTFLQYGIMAIAFFGDHIFKALNFTPPAIYHTLKEKKMMVFFFVFFLGNNLQSVLTSTGAFEVSLDGELVWSKIKSGAIPSIGDLENEIDRRLYA